jgi:hypothetical protein
VHERELSLYCVDAFSSHFPAEVNARYTENELIVGCSCELAELGSLCPHLRGLINNDPFILAHPINPEQIANLALFHVWLADTSCHDDMNKLDELERVVEELQRLKVLVKRRLRSGWKRESKLIRKNDETSNEASAREPVAGC